MLQLHVIPCIVIDSNHVQGEANSRANATCVYIWATRANICMKFKKKYLQNFYPRDRTVNEDTPISQRSESLLSFPVVCGWLCKQSVWWWWNEDADLETDRVAADA